MMKRDWVDNAKCRGADPMLFDRPDTTQFCAGCRVIRQCAREAVENRDRGVVRAGVFLSDNYSERVKGLEKLRRLVT